MYVYFIKCLDDNGYIKIGVAQDVKKRLDSLQTGCPYPLKVICAIGCDNREHALATEKRLHRYFGHSRVGGEWFYGGIKIDKLDESILDINKLDEIGVKRHARDIEQFRRRRYEFGEIEADQEVELEILQEANNRI